MSSPKDDYVRDKSLSFREKWSRRVQEKKNTGTASSALFLDQCVPYVFFFVYLGGVGWLIFCAVPHQHWRDPIWYFLNEVFTVYVFLQVLINWYLIYKTDSSYTPTDEQEVPSQNGTTSTNVDLEVPNDANFKSGLSYRMLVATAVTDGNIERKSFPYWSWVPCLMCKRPRPPRCHHCTICKRCVLKRDHHCYFTRACVGVNNQRYFLYFLFWCVILTTYGVCELVPFGYTNVFIKYSYWNLLFPVNCFLAISGQLPFLYLHFIIVTWGVVALTLISIGMFSMTLHLTLKGLTKFEFDNNIKVIDTRSKAGRFRAVLGRNWILPFLIPGYNNGSVLEDPVKWPHIKP